jgi:hypothetical protein
MNEWQLRELELQRKENAWFEALPEWMKIIDNHWYYIGILALSMPICFGIGLLIGWIIS